MFCARNGLTPAPGLPILPVEQRQIHPTHHAVGSLYVFGDAKSMDDQGRFGGGIESRGLADLGRRYATPIGYQFWRPFANEGAKLIPFGDPP